MTLKGYNNYFFLLVLMLVSVITFFIFKPFFTAILAAAVLAIISQKPYNFFLKITGNRRKISSVLTSILVILIVSVLLFTISRMVINEINGIYKNVSAEKNFYQMLLAKAASYSEDFPLLKTLKIGEATNQKELVESLKNLGQGALSIMQRTYQGVVGFLFWIFITFFTLYYFLIEGKQIVKKIIYLSPLSDTYEDKLISKFVSISRATLKGTIIIALIQGFIGGITFAITGVSSPVVWGLVMVILSIIPVLGSGFIWFPAGIIMLVLGNIWQGIAILAVGIGIISVIDNLLRPKLVGRDTQMHPLLVFFSTLGGIIVFGISGFIIGPIVMAFFLTLWEIYAAENV